MIRLTPRYLIFPRWPEDGDDWVHPEDRSTARRLLPSRRIFYWRRSVGPYRALEYGSLCLRAKPALCLEVRGDGLLVEDWVEIRSQLCRHHPGLAQIREMEWNAREERAEYRVVQRDLLLPNVFHAGDLQCLQGLVPLPERQPQKVLELPE